MARRPDLWDTEVTSVAQIEDMFFDAATELTISGGVCTKTQAIHTIDTEGDAASDDLDSLAGGVQEEIVILRPANAARTVVVKHGTAANQFFCPQEQDISLAEITDYVLLQHNGSQWAVLAYCTKAVGGGGLGSYLATATGGAAIGLADAGLNLTATTVEAAFAEILNAGYTWRDRILKAATELTIAGGVITATQGSHTVDTQGDAGTDDLDTIAGGTAEETIVLRPENAARSVVIKHGTGNILCPGQSDITLAEAEDTAVLFYNGSNWVVTAYSIKAYTVIGPFPDLRFSASTELTIAGGVVTCTQGYHSVDTQGDAGTDDLDTISGIADGEIVMLRAENDARDIIIKHGTGNIECPAGKDITLAEDDDYVLLTNNGTSVVVVGFKTKSATGGGLGAYLAATTGGAAIGLADAGARFATDTAEAALQQIAGTGYAWLDEIKAAATELTIAGGVITVTQAAHTVDTQGDAGTDDLDTIAGGTAEETIVLRPENAARSVVLKHGTGNILLPGGNDITLAEAEDMIELFYNGSNWVCLGYSTKSYDAGADLTIAGGVLATTHDYHRVNGQGATDDDIDTITGGTRGQRLMLENAVNTEKLTLKHSTVANGIRCPGGQDLLMTGDSKVELIYGGAGGVNAGWTVVAINGTLPGKPGSVVVPISGGVGDGGTWTHVQASTGLEKMDRTAAATVESWWMDVPIGPDLDFVPTGIECNYYVNTAAPDNIQIELWKVTQGVDGAARTAAVIFGNLDADYDAAHNTAAKRSDNAEAPELHRASVAHSAGGSVPLESNEHLKVRFYVDGEVGAAAVVGITSVKVIGRIL